MTKKISLYKISQELFIETDKKDKGYAFDDYYKEVLKKFNDLIARIGVNKEALKDKDGSYMINISQKNNVKELIRDYTSKSMKKVRKNKFTELEVEDLGQVVRRVESIIKGMADENTAQDELNNMYLKTRYPFLKKAEEIKVEGIAQVISDINLIQPVISEGNDYTLSDLDKICLLHYYKELIRDTSEKWIEVMDILSSNRFEELCEDDKVDSMMDSSLALLQAIGQYNIERIEETKQTKQDKMDSETSKQMKALIEDLEREYRK